MAAIVSTRILRLQAISPRTVATNLQSGGPTVGTQNVDLLAITDSSFAEQAGSFTIGGSFTGSVGAPSFANGIYTGVSLAFTSVQLMFGMMAQWQSQLLAAANARTQWVGMDRIEFDDAYSADLGNMTVTVVTDSGYQCLRFAYGAALPAGVVAAVAGSVLTIPKHPFMYVRRVDGPNGFIYASPSNVAASNVAWLLGTGTFPATLATKLWGSNAGNNLQLGTTRSMWCAANSSVIIPRTQYTNVPYSHKQLFAMEVGCWPTLYTDGSCGETSLTVNLLKR